MTNHGEYPSAPPTMPTERAMPPTGDIDLGGVDLDKITEQDQRGSILPKAAAGLLLTGALIGGVYYFAGAEESNNGSKDKRELAKSSTPEKVAADCVDPSDTPDFMFGETGKPVLSLDTDKRYSTLGVISAVAEKICTEREAVKYYSELQPLVAFGASDANNNPDKPVFDQIDADEAYGDKVARNLLDLLSEGKREAIVLGERPEIAAPLFTLRYNQQQNATYAMEISAEEAKNLYVVALTQNDGDAELNKAGVAKFLVLGKDENGNIVPTENSGSIIVTQEGLNGCIVFVPSAAESSETTAPISAGGPKIDEGNDDKGTKRGKKQGGGSNSTNGTDSGKSGHSGGECADDCGDHGTPTTAPPATNPPRTNPPATQPPVTRPPETNPPVTRPPETTPPTTAKPGKGSTDTIPTPPTTAGDPGWG